MVQIIIRGSGLCRKAMSPIVILAFCFLIAACSWTGELITEAKKSPDKGSITIRMPDVRPDHGDQYLCVAHRLPVHDNGSYIVSFKPLASADKIHHMIISTCRRPGIYQRDSPSFVWDCGHMSSEQENSIPTYERADICAEEQEILFAWAMNAPELKLPEGVGFKIGDKQKGRQFLVLQMHYGSYEAFESNPDLTDNSGLQVETVRNDGFSGVTKLAGNLLLLSYGHVKRGRSKHEITCDMTGDIIMHPFAYRVHTHKLGTKVYGALLDSKSKFRELESREFDMDNSTLIGIGDPQKPQIFAPIEDKNMLIRKGDTVYAACEFNNNRGHVVKIGPYAEDEMCNFYLMYWTDSGQTLANSYCMSLVTDRSYFDY